MRTAMTLLLLLSTILPAAGQGPIYIRGLRYEDMTRGTSIRSRTVAPGGVINIDLPRSFGNVLRAEVTLEDASRARLGGGVTNFSLSQRQLAGNRMLARAPAASNFVNQNFNVAVFVFVDGVTRFYANAGTVRIAPSAGLTPAATRSPTLGFPAVSIRGLRYGDMSSGTRLVQRRVAPGGTITIALPRSFGNVLRAEVVLEDVNRPRTGGGVTNFSLSQRRLSGNRIVARVPQDSAFLNRTFHVAVFIYVDGNTRVYGSAGNLDIVQPTPPVRYTLPDNRALRIPRGGVPLRRP